MLLRATNLSFSYGHRPVLRSISLDLRAGEVVALLGPNGSGKTTLLRCLLGHLSCSGTVRWNDIPLTGWRLRDLARTVAYLAQSPISEPGQRVSDVLRMGRAPYLPALGLESKHDIEVIHDVAATLMLEDLLDRRLDALSGGQRQRVFLGRCLVQEPRALLLDEPNTWLDLRNQVELGQLLADLSRKQGISILMASHDLNLAGQFADRLMILSEGNVAADGPPADVLRPALLEAVYGLPMERIETPGGRVYVVPGTKRHDETDVSDNG